VIRSDEVELKLEIAPGETAALRALPLLGKPARPPERQVTTYYDTPKGELRRSGYSLRVREKGGRRVQTVKHRGADAGGFSTRPEWESRIDGDALDFEALKATPVGEILSRRDMKKRLETVSETRVERTTWDVARSGAEIELILDEGEVEAGGATEPLCEVELELKSGDRIDLFALACEMSRSLGLRMGVLSKSERGFRLLEKKKARASKAAPVRLAPGTSAADAFAAIVQACLRHFRLNEPLLAEKNNAAALHQARVAIRRLRSALSLFRPVTAGAEHERLKGELRSFAAVLGEARNLDVLLEDKSSAAAPSQAARKALRKQRRKAYDEVREALAGRDLPRLILELVAWAEAGEWRSSPAAAAAIEPFAVERLDRAWKRVRRGRKTIAGDDPEERHRLRIEVKKLRYAAEFFSGLGPKRRRRARTEFLSKLSDLQDTLGRLNDIETARQIAPEDEAEATPDASAEIDRLIAQAAAGLEELRADGAYWH
jgi:inorganic triphosphatase YgiF